MSRQGWERPDPEFGVHVEWANDPAKYITKAGLSQEMTDVLARDAGGGNLTPWQALAVVYGRAEEGRPPGSRGEVERLLLGYLRAMRGRPPMRWSPGLKGEFGVTEKEWPETRAE